MTHSCPIPVSDPGTEPSVKSESLSRRPLARLAAALPLCLSLPIGVLSFTACATSKLDMSTTAPKPDPRVGLRAGWMNAAEAAWNLRLVSHTAPSAQFINQSTPGDFNFINSDLSFVGNYVIQGNFGGY